MKGVVDKIATEVINHVVDTVSQNKGLLEKNAEELKNYLKKTLKGDRKLIEKITNLLIEGDKND